MAMTVSDKVQPLLQALEQLREDPDFEPYAGSVGTAYRMLSGIPAKEAALQEQAARKAAYAHARWDRRDYRGLPHASRMRDTAMALAAHFKRQVFASVDAACYMREYNWKRLETMGMGVGLLNESTGQLFNAGVLERRPISGNAFQYRFVPRALRELREK